MPIGRDVKGPVDLDDIEGTMSAGSTPSNGPEKTSRQAAEAPASRPPTVRVTIKATGITSTGGNDKYSNLINQRRHGRVRCQNVHCNLGDVQDISASGMRIITRWKPPGPNHVFPIEIDSIDGLIVLEARAMWSKRVGWFKREIGLRFESVPRDASEALARLARAAAYNETIRPDIDKFRHAS